MIFNLSKKLKKGLKLPFLLTFHYSNLWQGLYVIISSLVGKPLVLAELSVS